MRRVCFYVATWCLLASGLFASCGPQGELKTNLKDGALVFPTAKLFESQKASVFVYNPKAGPVVIKEVKLQGDQAVHFELLRVPSTPHTLESGVGEDGKQKGEWLILQFFASQPGTFQASLEISYQQPEGEQVGKLLIPLKAEAQAANNNDARLKFEPVASTLNFGTFTTRDTQTMELLLYNEGNAPITVDFIDIVDNQGETFTLPFPLPQPFQVFPGKANGRIVLIQAQNGKEGTYEAWLRVGASNALNIQKQGTRLVKLKVKITQYMTPGNLQFNVPSGRVYFKEVPPNEVRKQEVTIFNSGQLPVKVLSVKVIEDPSKVWSLQGVPDTPFMLEGGGMGNGRSFTVQFQDPKPNYRVSRLLIEYLIDPDNPEAKHSTMLSLYHEKARALFTLGCNTINFGAVKKGNWELRLCTLRSTGNIDLEVKSIKWESIKGKVEHFSLEQPSVPFQLRPHNSISLQIKYTPSTTPSQDEARLVLETNLLIEKEEDKPRILLIGESRE